jgi:hypothetical protein
MEDESTSGKLLTGVIFGAYVIDCLVPDPLPYIDEIALFLILMDRGGNVIKALTMFIAVADVILKIP